MQTVGKQQKKSSLHIPAAGIYLLLLALLLYVVLPQINAFNKSIPLLRSIAGGWLLVAIGFSLIAHTAAGFKYAVLALKPVRLFAAIVVQFASLLVNRLLPVGIGGMGINFVFLRKARHSKVEAGVVVSMNNVVGLTGHFLLIACLLLATPETAQHVGLHFGSRSIVFGVLVALVVLFALYVVRRRVHQALRDLQKSLRFYSSHPIKFLAAVMWSVVIAAAYAACLWASARALNIDIGYLSALIVLTLGVAATSVSPTPGGLVGVEAALLLGLVAYGLSSASALAVALLYRLITYWFALLLGGFAFVFCRRAKYI